jgi:hypothetical protein
MVESPSSESLSSLSRWGVGDHDDEVVSMESTQEGEDFAVGEAIESLIEKLNGTPRSEDSDESIRALLYEAVAAGGSNLRENMALYFVTKRGLEFGIQRETIDEMIEDAASAAENDADQSVEVSPAASTADKKPDLTAAAVNVLRAQSGVNAVKHAEGTYEDDLPDLVPDIPVVEDLLTPTGPTDRADAGATRAVRGALLPPPGQLDSEAIGLGSRSVKAAPAPPSTRGGSLQ